MAVGIEVASSNELMDFLMFILSYMLMTILMTHCNIIHWWILYVHVFLHSFLFFLQHILSCGVICLVRRMPMVDQAIIIVQFVVIQDDRREILRVISNSVPLILLMAKPWRLWTVYIITQRVKIFVKFSKMLRIRRAPTCQVMQSGICETEDCQEHHIRFQ